MSEGARLIAVTDTNFWLHTKLPFDFVAFLGVARPIVVITTTVVDELDKHRATGASRQIRDRARAVLNDLRALMRRGLNQQGRLVSRSSDGVAFWFLPEADRSGSADERIVSNAQKLSTEGHTVLVSADAGMELRALLVSIPVRVVPEDLLQKDRPDRDLVELQQRVAALEKKVPKLNVKLDADVLVPADRPLELLRLDPPTEHEFDQMRTEIPTRMSNLRNPPISDLVQYHTELPEYAARLTAYIASLARWEALAEAALLVELTITNLADEPVADAVIWVDAPWGATLDDLGNRPRAPSPPARPVRPLTAMEGVMLAVQRAQAPILTSFLQAPVPSPAWAPRVNRYDRRAIVTLNQPLRPGYPTFAGRLWIALAPEFPDGDLGLEYVVFGAASGKPQQGKLSISIQHHHERWSVPGLPTFLAPELKVSRRSGQKERYEERERQATIARMESEYED